jgi:phosphoglycolate phosphatase
LPMKVLLFDLDLTLISTGGAGLRALGRAFEDVLGLEGALASITPDGKTDPAIIREACVKKGIEPIPELTRRLLDRYVRLLGPEVRLSTRYRVLPGVVALLEEVGSRSDVAVGLATGNVEAGARLKLEPGGLNVYFPFGGFGSDSEDRAEVVRTAERRARIWSGAEPDPEHTHVIGDTPRDIEAGRRAGFRTVGVATGRHSLGTLEAAGADCVVPDLATGRDQFMRSTRIL